VEGMTKCLRVPQQTDKAFGEIFGMRQRPQRCAVAMHDDFLAAQHTVGHSVGSIADSDGNRQIVGVRRPHNSYRKTFVAIGAIEHFLARDFITRVLPEWVHQRRRFGNNRMRSRALVNRGRTDEDELRRLAFE
jgi:hypothetical protein